MTDNKREKGAFLRCDHCAAICNNPLAVEIKNSTLYCCGKNDCMTFLQSLAPPSKVVDPCDDCKMAEKTDAIEENGVWYLLCKDCLMERIRKK